MAVNSAGLQIVSDGGIPQTITGYAAEVISGGEFVNASGADSVSSGVNSFITGDVVFNNGASGLLCNGIAASNVASGAILTVYTKGIFISRASATVTAGQEVMVDGAEAVEANSTAAKGIGRAINGGTSGNYALIKLDL